MGNVVSYTHDGIDYVTVEDIKAHLRIDDTDEDAFLESLIEGAFDIASNYVGYSLRKASVAHWFDTSTDGCLYIPARVLSITSVQYVNDAGTLTAINYNTYGETTSKFLYKVELTADPTSLNDYGKQYKVICVEGFELQSATADSFVKFPNAIKSAIYMICANLYENRQDDVIGTISSELPMNSKYLLDPYKVTIFV